MHKCKSLTRSLFHLYYSRIIQYEMKIRTREIRFIIKRKKNFSKNMLKKYNNNNTNNKTQVKTNKG